MQRSVRWLLCCASVASFAALLAACSSSADSADSEGMYGPSGYNGNSGNGGSGGSSQGYSDASTSGDAWLNQHDAAPPPSDAAADAQPDTEQPDADTCALLDNSKPLVLYQSADDSNSMSSPVIARRYIKAHQRVPGYVLRTYEFLNYYSVLYEPPAKGHVMVVPQMRAGKNPGEYTLQVGLQAEPVAIPRRPMNITFVLDNTGSMSGRPLALEKATVKAIAGSMKTGDIVSMLAWNTDQWVLLDNLEVTGPNDSQLLAAADKLTAEGSTDLHAGLVKGYELAKTHYDPNRMNRVVLVSDGVANVGVVDEQMIAKESHAEDGEGIYLMGVGVGDGINDTLLNVVTDKGRGAYIYLDTEEEAAKVFGSRFDEVFEVAVRDIKLELTVPWYFTLKTTSAEQTSTNPQEVDPQYLAPGDAVVINNTFLPCAESQWKDTDVVQARATYKRPFTQEPGEDTVTMTLGELLSGSADQLAKGTAIVAYAEALKKVQSKSGEEAQGEIDKAIALVKSADPDGKDADLVEILALLTEYRTVL
ncbi:MAG: VWA domain-containing protein [Deltaproteobacteria bacterium]|nr:VWA domain-containing protein [Deltaproteobacteria bacterium]